MIADIDATRRKVEESTRKTEELLAELKQQLFIADHLKEANGF